jgi:hypothetical protein
MKPQDWLDALLDEDAAQLQDQTAVMSPEALLHAQGAVAADQRLLTLHQPDFGTRKADEPRHCQVCKAEPYPCAAVRALGEAHRLRKWLRPGELETADGVRTDRARRRRTFVSLTAVSWAGRKEGRYWLHPGHHALSDVSRAKGVRRLSTGSRF